MIEYRKTAPSRALLIQLIARAGIIPRELLREKGTPYADLGLGDAAISDDALIDALMEHPILINRPLVVSPLRVTLCRPSAAVPDLPPAPQQGASTQANGTQPVAASGARG